MRVHCPGGSQPDLIQRDKTVDASCPTSSYAVYGHRFGVRPPYFVSIIINDILVTLDAITFAPIEPGSRFGERAKVHRRTAPCASSNRSFSFTRPTNSELCNK